LSSGELLGIGTAQPLLKEFLKYQLRKNILVGISMVWTAKNLKP
jgi:hypothetical protein